jgi:hypothetical protein
MTFTAARDGPAAGPAAGALVQGSYSSEMPRNSTLTRGVVRSISTSHQYHSVSLTGFCHHSNPVQAALEVLSPLKTRFFRNFALAKKSNPPSFEKNTPPLKKRGPPLWQRSPLFPRS